MIEISMKNQAKVRKKIFPFRIGATNCLFPYTDFSLELKVGCILLRNKLKDE